MNNLISLAKRYKILSFLFTFLSLGYAIVALTRPTNKAAIIKYHVSGTRLHEITLAVILPYVVIWFIAFIGCLWLRSYGDSLGKSKDGDAFRTISTGILWFTFWLALSNLATTITTSIYTSYPSSTAVLVQFITYLNIVLLAPAFLWVNRGAQQLVGLVRTKITAPSSSVVMIFIAFSVLYTTVVLRDPNIQVPVPGSIASYYLPDWVLITTVIIPRLLFWFLGVQAVQNIVMYRRKVRGIIYKEALKDLALGLAGVVMGIVVLRTIQSLSASLDRLNLGAILLVVYILLILLSVGYVYIARGARKLIRIEES